MLPLVLDLARLKLALVGNGAAALRRLELLDAAGAVDLAVYADAASPALALAAGARLRPRLPTAQELVAARVVFLSDRNAPHCDDLAATARAGGALVHVEDEPALSDIHAPAVLRRGDLLIAVSTGGRAPGLAGRIKRFLGAVFGSEWQSHVEALAALRRGWHDSGTDSATVAQWSDAWVTGQGWLPAENPTSPAAAGARADAHASLRH
jgi:precorrin-2 dehydrogenase / sirohydrochlorin ferrochelatase